MKLLAITSFPPSVRGSNSFGYHAVSRFLELPGVTKIIVIADILTDDLKKNIHEEILVDERLTIDRQWQYNSIKNLFQIIRATISYNPDIVWVNLQYTSFGSNLITAFLGLCIPGTLRLLGYSVIVLLHNFLGGTDLDKMSFSYSGIVRKLTLYVDKIAMRSIMSSNKVFTMVEGYQKELSYAYPNTDVEYVRQDLFAVPEYKPANKTSLKILTLGYFGTYKKLDVLLNAFLLVRRDLPNTSLTIAGSNNSHAPGYLEKLQEEHIGKEKNVEFSGYVAENELANLFWGSNIVVITIALLQVIQASLSWLMSMGGLFSYPNKYGIAKD